MISVPIIDITYDTQNTEALILRNNNFQKTNRQARNMHLSGPLVHFNLTYKLFELLILRLIILI